MVYGKHGVVHTVAEVAAPLIHRDGHILDGRNLAVIVCNIFHAVISFDSSALFFFIIRPKGAFVKQLLSGHLSFFTYYQTYMSPIVHFTKSVPAFLARLSFALRLFSLFLFSVPHAIIKSRLHQHGFPFNPLWMDSLFLRSRFAQFLILPALPATLCFERSLCHGKPACFHHRSNL